MFLVAVALADVSVDESGGSLSGEKVSGPFAHPVQAGIEAHSRRQASGESRPAVCSGFKWAALSEQSFTCSGPGWSLPVFFAESDSLWRAAASDSNFYSISDNDAVKSV